MNIFEEASRTELRFASSKGILQTEDLWNLTLDNLNKIAIGLSKQVDEAGEQSFIEKSTVDSVTQLSFDIVKHVIKTRLEERKANKEKVERHTHKQKILAAMVSKQDDKLSEMSMEDLQAELEKL